MSCPGGSSFSGPQRILSVVGKVGSVQFMVGFQAGSMGRADRGSQPGLGFPYRCGDQSGQAGASCTRKDCIDPATPHQQQPVPATFVNGVNLRARSKPKTGAGSLGWDSNPTPAGQAGHCGGSKTPDLAVDEVTW